MTAPPAALCGYRFGSRRACYDGNNRHRCIEYAGHADRCRCGCGATTTTKET